jgi:hypothetical protein
MYPRIRLIIFLAAVLVLCRAMVDRGEATVIHDGKTGQFNPAVEAGGQLLPTKEKDKQSQGIFPYSLIGSLKTESTWFPPCVVWPWRVFSPVHRYRPDASGSGIGTSSGSGSINRLVP